MPVMDGWQVPSHGSRGGRDENTDGNTEGGREGGREGASKQGSEGDGCEQTTHFVHISI